jgi:gamma-polyglutamate biosynthesis protein CapA
MERQLSWNEKLQKTIKKHKRKRKQHTIIAIGITLLILFVLRLSDGQLEPLSPKHEDGAVLTAHFVGDMMLGRHVEEVTARYGYDYLFRYVEPLFRQSNFVTGNFEHPVLQGDESEYPATEKFIRIGAPPESVEALKRNHFSNVTLANNHTMDFGVPGLRDTLETFEQADMPYVGAGRNESDAQEILYQEVNGLTIATLGFTDSYVQGFSAAGLRGGVLTIPTDFTNAEAVINMLTLIRRAKQNADLVLVHVHWGQEYDNSPHPRQVSIGRAFANAGADIIIGHHPHVLMSTEVYEHEQYEDSIIFYSLGNFIFDQGWSRTRESAIAEYKLYPDGTARVEMIPMYIREATPRPVQGLFSGYRESRIFRALTKDAPKDTFWKEDGRLFFEVDHSHVLEGNITHVLRENATYGLEGEANGE